LPIAKIAMHTDDSSIVKRGDMSVNRKTIPDRISPVFKLISTLMSFFMKPGKFDTFKPKLTIDESFNLLDYGLDAKVVHLPGHSKGSIGVPASGGELFYGDLLNNMFGFNLIDDLPDHSFSFEKLKKLIVKTIYPGHGKPFSEKQFLMRYR
jgi:hydroxyacylglutathione hydrolase